MNLNGQIQDFELSKFLQFLSLDNASGELELNHQDDRVVIQFLNGNICDIEHKSDSKVKRMGDVLVDGERIDGAKFSALMQEMQSSGRSLGSLLQKYGAVSAEEMEELNHLVCNDILIDALQWDSCEYTFKTKKNDNNGGNGAAGGFSMPMQQVLLEAYRQEDSWGFVRQIVPVVDVVFKPIVTPKTKEEWKAIYAKCNEKDRRVIRLLNGRNTVQKIAHKALRSVFDVSRILWQLERNHLIEKVRKPVISGQDRWEPGYFDIQYNLLRAGIFAAIGTVIFITFLLLHAYFG